MGFLLLLHVAWEEIRVVAFVAAAGVACVCVSWTQASLFFSLRKRKDPIVFLCVFVSCSLTCSLVSVSASRSVSLSLSLSLAVFQIMERVSNILVSLTASHRWSEARGRVRYGRRCRYEPTNHEPLRLFRRFGWDPRHCHPRGHW